MFKVAPTMSSECMDWVQEQADEIEAIGAIYEEEWKCVATTPPQYALSLPVGAEKSRNLDVEVSFPNGYPTHCPIHIVTRSEWISAADRSAIDSIISAAKCRLEGACQVHEIIMDICDYFADRHFEKPCDSPRAVPCPKNEQAEKLGSATERKEPCAADTKGSFLHTERRGDTRKGNQSEQVDCIEIFRSEPLVDRKSVFQAHMARVKSKQEVETVLNELRSCKKIADATHNVYAYRIATDRGTIEDCDDDGETAAGSRMLHLLHILDVIDVLVVVTRWFGGVLLGADRFRDYNNCCRQILDENGLIREKAQTNKKSTTRSKKKT